MYLNIFGNSPKPLIKEIHLGGGTPTFFSPENLQFLIRNILEKCEVHPDAQFSFEAHPGNTTDEHLTALYEVGFRRISIGVQDFNPMVLAVINRHQTYEQVCHLTRKAREIGFTSVNFDVVYGLPMQKSCYMMETMMKVVKLNPDRIAFYSYAHVPWIKPGQRRYTESDLPDSDKKMALYETGRNVLELAGYQDVGMDHFARETDSLFEAKKQGKLHRNFMGYTDTHTQLLIGLGVSAISDSWWGYAQNEKKLEDYYLKVESGHLPIFRGHELSPTDIVLRGHILNLMTKFETSWTSESPDEVNEAVERLNEAESDELVEIFEKCVRITEKGKPFIRNICMAFDARLWEEVSDKTVFSQSI
jgi:oxygen-independent coproporphyrinogen-3 oxidase